MAGELTWTYDMPSGTYKSHTLSNKLRYQALREMVCMPFCKTEPGFGKHKGDTITLTRVDQLSLPTSGQLEETTKIPIDPLTLATTPITVSEWGRGVEYTNLAQDLSKFDPETIIQKVLINQQKMILDNAVATAMRTTYMTAIPASLTSITWEADATATATAYANMNVGLCGIIRDYFRDTLVIPPYSGNDYIGIGSTKLLRGIKSDPDFLAWRQYIRPEEVLLRSEVGTVENIKWVETNNTTQFSNAKGSGGVLGEGVVFGDDFCVMVEVETPELRAGIPADGGRQKVVYWYGVLAFGLVWPTTGVAGKVKGALITSA